MHRTTNNLLDALKENDLERAADARRDWVKEGCPDHAVSTPAPRRTFCDRLRTWRDLRGYTLRDLSDRAKVGQTRLFRLETGHEPTLGEWKRLRLALGIKEEEGREMERLV